MKRHKIVLVRGVCGAGKTHWINQHKKENDQIIDFSNMLDIDWSDRPRKALEQIDRNAETTYIEAIFADGSPSYLDIMLRLSLMNISLYEVIIHRPYRACREGVLAGDPEKAKKRIEILDRYWPSFEHITNKSGKVKRLR